MDTIFGICSNIIKTYPQNIVQRIVEHLMRLQSDVVLRQILTYRRSISTGMKLLIFERQENVVRELCVLRF